MPILAYPRWPTTTAGRTLNELSAELEWDVDGTQDEWLAILAPGIPVVGSQHPRNASLFCRRVYVKSRPGIEAWVVAAEFDRASGSSGGSTDPENPLAAPVEYIWVPGLSSEPSDEAIDPANPDGLPVPITNSAGDPPSSGFDNTFPTLTLDAWRNESSFDPTVALTFMNKVNDGSWNVAGKIVGDGQALCLFIGPDSPYTLGAPFVRVRYSFEFRADGFRLRVKDQGKRALYTISGTDRMGFINSYDENLILSPVTDDVHLDGHGLPIDQTKFPAPSGKTYKSQNAPRGSLISLKEGTNAAFLFWERKRKISFSPLNL